MSLFSKKRTYNTAFIPEITKDESVNYEKDFFESFLDRWHFETYTGNAYSKTDNLHDEFEKDIAETEKVTGENLKNPYNSAFEEFFIEDVAMGIVNQATKNPFDDKSSRYHPENVAKREQERLSKYYQRVEKLKLKYPELKARDIETINQDIKKQALEYYQNVNDGRKVNFWGDFLGSMAAAMIDPINAAATLVTGGGNAAKTTVAKALGKTAVNEFVVNSGIEAFIQPSVYKYKKELGLPYSKTEAALNVVAAGAGGAILGTTAKALNLGGRELLNKFKAAEAKGVKFDAKTKEAARLLENQVEFDEWAAATNPLGDDHLDLSMHKRSILEAERRLTEENDISKGFDLVSENIEGDPMEVLASIKPEDLEGVEINRGGYEKNNGVKGSGFGMVKFVWKHGIKGKDEIPIEKADIMDFPRVIRDFEPVINDKYGSNRTWSVKRADGKQIIYADRVFLEDGERHLVTIHVIGKDNHNLKGKFSEPRREAKPAHTKDTTQEAYYRTDESSANASTPKSRFHDGGEAHNLDITPETPKVKDFSDLDLNVMEKSLDDDLDISLEDKAALKEQLGKMRQEEAWDSEIIDCIVEFKQR